MKLEVNNDLVQGSRVVRWLGGQVVRLSPGTELCIPKRRGLLVHQKTAYQEGFSPEHCR